MRVASMSPTLRAPTDYHKKIFTFFFCICFSASSKLRFGTDSSNKCGSERVWVTQRPGNLYTSIEVCTNRYELLRSPFSKDLEIGFELLAASLQTRNLSGGGGILSCLSREHANTDPSYCFSIFKSWNFVLYEQRKAMNRQPCNTNPWICAKRKQWQIRYSKKR
jgi:hypothetical protein